MPQNNSRDHSMRFNQSKLPVVVLVLAVLLVTLMTFSPVLTSDFVNWDDETILLKNPLVKSLSVDNIVRIFRTPIIKIYSPLVTLSFAIEYHFFKFDPFIYHLDNLLLHLGILLLIFWFTVQLGLNTTTALLSALLFGIHPMHVESVAWVTERKDVLYAFFYMLSLNFYLRSLATGRTKFYVLAALAGLLSMLSKPMALSLPLIFYLCNWFRGDKFDRATISKGMFLFVYIIPIAWWTYRLQNYHYAANFYDEVLKTIWVFVFYIRKFFIPTSLGMFYELPGNPSLWNVSYLGAVSALIFLAALIFYFRRNKILVFANLFYIFSIFFALRRVQEHSPGGAPFYSIEDRCIYLPSLGYCILVAWALTRILRFYRDRSRFKALFVSVIIAILLVWLSFAAFLQCRKWTNSMMLWDSVIAHNPGSAIAYNNRGTQQTADGLALDDYNKAISLDPHFIEAYFNRAGILSRMGDYRGAIADYAKCIQVNPHDAEAYYLRSRNYEMLGDAPKALADASKAKSLGFKVGSGISGAP